MPARPGVYTTWAAHETNGSGRAPATVSGPPVRAASDLADVMIQMSTREVGPFPWGATVGRGDAINHLRHVADGSACGAHADTVWRSTHGGEVVRLCRQPVRVRGGTLSIAPLKLAFVVAIMKSDPVVIVSDKQRCEEVVLCLVINAGELAAKRFARLLGDVVRRCVEREEIAVVFVLMVATRTIEHIGCGGVAVFTTSVTTGHPKLLQAGLPIKVSTAVTAERQPNVRALSRALDWVALHAVGQWTAARLQSRAVIPRKSLGGPHRQQRCRSLCMNAEQRSEHEGPRGDACMQRGLHG